MTVKEALKNINIDTKGKTLYEVLEEVSAVWNEIDAEQKDDVIDSMINSN